MFKTKLSTTLLAAPQRAILLLAFTLVASSLAPKPGSAQPSPKPSIFAGEGMGKIAIGDSRSSVRKKLGNPTQSSTWLKLPVAQDVWVSQKTGSRLTVLYPTKTLRVAQIETTSPKFTTPAGVSVQTPLREVRAYLGQEEKGLLLKTGIASPRYYFHGLQRFQGHRLPL